jgi:hypothetical protein
MNFLLGACCVLIGCSAPKKPDYFPDPSLLESDLVMGVATESEVIELMGQPNGRGATLLPPEHYLQEILYYEFIDLGEVRSLGGGDLEVDMNARVLSILLREGIYDGFLWFSYELSAEGKGDAGPVIVQ